MKRSELAAILRIMDPDTLYIILHDEKPFPPLIYVSRKSKTKRLGTGPYGYRLLLSAVVRRCEFGWENTTWNPTVSLFYLQSAF